jgi:acyl dehydratase
VTVLTDLSAGHVFEPLSVHLDPERALAYREAVGDRLGVYDAAGAVPPLAVAAVALGALLDSVSLPPGTLHVNESLTFHKAVPPGSEVECRAVLAQRSLRGGLVVSVIESDIRLGGQTAVRARATVMSPQAA